MKILKTLKKHWLSMLIMVVLLAAQAITDLKLPDYTSKIISIGVQQGGVENATPNIIRESELNKVLLFLNDKDKDTILDNYKVLTKNDYENYENYPLLEKENLYVLNIKDDIKIEDLNELFGKPILVVSALSSSDDVASMIQMDDMNIPEGMDVFTAISYMDSDTRNKMLENIDIKTAELTSMIIDQAAVTYVRAEYKIIGINTDQMQTDYVITSGLNMLVIALISMICAVGVTFVGGRMSAAIAMELRGDVFKKVLSFSSVEFKKYSTASLITRSTNDIQQVQQLFVMVTRFVVYAPILAVGAVIKVMNTNMSMVWIIALAVTVILSVVLTLFILGVPKFKKVQSLVDKLNLVTREILTGIPVVRAFGNEKKEESRFDEANTNLKKTNLFVDRLMSTMMPIMMLVMNGTTLMIIWHGAKGIDAGTLQIGEMMAFIQYGMQIIMAFLMISMVSIILPRALVSVKRINEVLSDELVVKEIDKPKKFKGNIKGLVEFKNVGFMYPDADTEVISDISFTAESGKTTAFIGSTGSGKSTLINLIPRLYDVSSGEILVNGINIKEVTLNDLHDKIGYIPQKGILFSGTIESNIKYSNEDMSDKDMIRAARIAQAENFIDEKDEKYSSAISQGGTNVSGGQKQRLSIARAIAKNPEIYIFDDSFSALDYKTDVALRRDLKKETKDATVLIVAQRVSTIMNADQIIVLDEGKIVGIGKHKELLKNCSVYNEIASSQLTKEELANE